MVSIFLLAAQSITFARGGERPAATAMEIHFPFRGVFFFWSFFASFLLLVKTFPCAAHAIQPKIVNAHCQWAVKQQKKKTGRKMEREKYWTKIGKNDFTVIGTRSRTQMYVAVVFALFLLLEMNSKRMNEYIE